MSFKSASNSEDGFLCNRQMATVLAAEVSSDPNKDKRANMAARVDDNTLELLQSIFGSCQCLCRQLGRCSDGDNPCSSYRGPNSDLQGTLAQNCNVDMMKSRLEQSMRLIEIGRWAAELIHNIKHPVATVSSAAQTLQNLPSMEGSSLRLAAIIREEINHLNKLVDGLLHMVKPEQVRFMAYEVNELIDKIVPLIKRKMSDNGNITFRWEPDPGRAVVLVDADQMQEVFTNIAVNALESIQGEGTLAIAAKANQDTVQIAFADTGLGISEHELGLIFNPFYSTKMNGIGLGLVIARRIVEDHGGYIDVVSPAEAGTTFTVTLPRQVE